MFTSLSNSTRKVLPLAIALLAPAAVKAGSYSFTDTSSTIENLAHGTSNTWGLTNTVAGSTGTSLTSLETAIKSGQNITSATLTLTGIWDWTSEPGDVLYVNILNNVATGDHSYTYDGSPDTRDTTYGTDPFVVGTTNYATTAAHLSFTGVTSGTGQTDSLLKAPVTAVNPSSDPGTWSADNYGGSASDASTVVITLTSANIALLDSYLSTDSSSTDIGLGFGPDCHFYDSGVTLSITTGSSSVPDNGSTLIALGCALVALVGFRRFSQRSVVA
jgi:hypothetical protein